MRPLKILLAVHHFPPARVGGGELLALRLARWMQARGHQIQVVCVEEIHRGTRGELTWTDETFQDIPVRRFSFNLAASADPLTASFDNARLREHFETLQNTFQPDVVHLVSGYLLGIAPLRAAHARGIPTVVTLTDFWFLCPTLQLLRADGSLCGGPQASECARCLWSQRRSFRALERVGAPVTRRVLHAARQVGWLGTLLQVNAQLATLARRSDVVMQELNRAHTVIALTRFAAELHIAHGLARARVVVSPDCLDAKEFDPPAPHAPQNDALHFGYFGQIMPIKGADVLLRAFQRAQKTNPTARRMRLTLYGKTNTAPAYAKQLAQLANGNPDIVFAGEYEHRRTLALMSQVDAVIVPSQWYENSPRVILEAFAARTPVIGANVGGIAEVVTHEKNGLLFERGSAADLARQLTRVTQEPARLAALRANIPRVRQVDETMQELLQIYFGATAHADSPHNLRAGDPAL
jgi:glycosyltransferase involved in cell wall biosynthesis